MKPIPNEEGLLAEALLRPAGADRAAFLDEACGGNSALRRRLEALLGAVEKAGKFLEQPPVQLRARTTHVVPITEKAGDQIGRYKLLQQIGEGGCGVVYMAEQAEPIRRRVALKVIKLGMDTKSVIARFEAERQALALMDHPNIAKVLDAGSTEAGRPYFVMELVRGVRLTEYCDQHKLPVRERLGLFVKACQAIQHAHQKGIIHRDIKPSNILVTMHDGVPVPKVIDFGIAKATDQKLTDKTLFTQYDAFIGTPAYMSPEQAEMSGLDIDTRSDVYSLGVLLYELLTGVTPFNPVTLFQSGLDEMRRIIREEEPPRPSTRLSTLDMEGATTLAQHRQEKLSVLVNLMRGDLDWIVMKCLEKDRQRRYETASGLAMDIERHLGNETVLARPPSATYRLQRMVLRNKLAFSAAGAVFLALLLGLGLTFWMFLKAREAEKRAWAEANGNTEVAMFLQDILNGAGEAAARGEDSRMIRNFLDRAAERLSLYLSSDERVRASLSQAIGNVYLELGEFERAEWMLVSAADLARQHRGSDHAGILHALHSHALALLGLGRLDEAEAAMRDYISAHQGFVSTPICAMLAGDGMGRVLLAQGRYREAEAAFHAADRVQTGNLDGNVITSEPGEDGDLHSRRGGFLFSAATSDSTLSPSERVERFAAIEPLLLAGQSLIDKSSTVASARRHAGIERLIRLYDAWERLEPRTGKAEKAAEWQQKLSATEHGKAERSSRVQPPSGDEKPTAP